MLIPDPEVKVQQEQDLFGCALVRTGYYAAWLFIGTTVLSALGEQLSQIGEGRDPLDMSDPKFWAKSAMRGGGVGLIGDFLFADQNRYGGGIVASLARAGDRQSAPQGCRPYPAGTGRVWMGASP